MGRANGELRFEWIRQPSELARIIYTTVGRGRAVSAALGRRGSFRKGWATVTKEHEQVGRAVVVDVDDRPGCFVRTRVKLFDEVSSTVEVPIGFATNQDSALVDLLDVGTAVEVAVDVDFGELASTVVPSPRVGATVAVVIFGLQLYSGRPRLNRSDGGESPDAERRGEPAYPEALH
jgi:hypothetical protein